jgi:hypothetical protein
VTLAHDDVPVFRNGQSDCLELHVGNYSESL